MSWFEFACVCLAACIFAFWSYCMLRSASESDEWWEERERETAEMLAACERHLAATR